MKTKNGSNGHAHRVVKINGFGRTREIGLDKPANGRPVMREIAGPAAAAAAAGTTSPAPARATSSAKLEIHPFAYLAPPLTAPQREALKAEIAGFGRVRIPIVLHEGKVLDGRNRYEIAAELGVPFQTRQFDPATEGDPVQFVYSALTGRHMTESQMAATAVGLLDHFERMAAARKSANGGEHGPNGEKLVGGKTRNQMRALLKQNGPAELKRKYELHATLSSVLEPDAPSARKIDMILERMYGPEDTTAGRARDQAAAPFGISGRLVQDAKLLKERDPGLFDKVFWGELTVGRAKSEWVNKTKTHALKVKSDAAAREYHGVTGLWELTQGDCLTVLAASKLRARLAVTDPPYNIGRDYGLGPKADQMPESQYERWCEQWFALLAEGMSEDATICVMIDGRHQAMYHQILQRLGWHWRNTMIMVEEFGNYTDANFTPCARFIHYFTRQAKRFVWNGNHILIPSARQEVYADKRAVESGKVPGNVWREFPRLVGNAEEKMPGFDNQLPVALVERIVRACSDPGDLVIDPFNGTGTTGVAAIRNGRRYFGVELVENNAKWSRARLTAVSSDLARDGDSRGTRRK